MKSMQIFTYTLALALLVAGAPVLADESSEGGAGVKQSAGMYSRLSELAKRAKDSVVDAAGYCGSKVKDAASYCGSKVKDAADYCGLKFQRPEIQLLVLLQLLETMNTDNLRQILFITPIYNCDSCSGSCSASCVSGS